ncbi:hypothetical protein [Catenovulum maritimum]|uniref:Uncharacterized protein n=1 Tax=Catenovulum maritimum TaxID=1513271 RepID=A0A0J8GM84_9ALTE|nr:hypothetical protein [Catenovulum maritimum]KMT63885.1 hypothetical protein XM47_17170 [Catenovulum maritimum]
MKTSYSYLMSLVWFICATSFSVLAQSHVEQDGIVIVEAENFSTQHLDEKRRWVVFSANQHQHNLQDSDLPHFETASGQKYIEVLPDTRASHYETLVRGENFTDQGGNIAVLSYPILFNQAGKYYIWARAYSSNSEDNGVHFGLNGNWPESSRRLQLCLGKYQWTWSSAQRVPENHCGVPNTISLDIPHAGVHNVMVSMREDGFELDKFILTRDKGFKPNGLGGEETLSITNPLPEKEILHGINEYKRILFATEDFVVSGKDHKAYYKNFTEQALAIDSAKLENRDRYFSAKAVVDSKDVGINQLVLVTLAETKGESSYKILLNNKVIANFTNPKSTQDKQEVYFKINNIELRTGDVLEVEAMAVGKGRSDVSQGLWRALVLVGERVL